MATDCLHRNFRPARHAPAEHESEFSSLISSSSFRLSPSLQHPPLHLCKDSTSITKSKMHRGIIIPLVVSTVVLLFCAYTFIRLHNDISPDIVFKQDIGEIYVVCTHHPHHLATRNVSDHTPTQVPKTATSYLVSNAATVESRKLCSRKYGQSCVQHFELSPQSHGKRCLETFLR